MGLSKAILEEKKAARQAKAARKAKAGKKANFVDMKPDKVEKESIKAINERFDEFMEYFEKAIIDERIRLNIKFDDINDCWAIQVYNGDDKWPNVTYYTFRHRKLPIVLCHVVYVCVEQWQGVLPIGEAYVEDIDW